MKIYLTAFFRKRFFLKTSFLILLIFLWLWRLNCFAQNIESICKPEISHFTRQIYNANYQNWGIARHPKTRFMYFANSRGLLEFDGSTWRVFELPQKQIVRSVAIDSLGQIYTGGLGEFGCWKPNLAGVLSYQSFVPLIHDKGFRREAVWNILPTEKGIIFQSFALLFIYRNNTVRKLELPGNILFMHNVKNRLFVGVIDKGLFELKNDRFELIKGSEFLGKESVNIILPTRTDDILVGTSKSIYRFNGKNFLPFNAETNLFVQQNQLNKGICLNNGNYAFGTILNGVIITSQSGEILMHLNTKNGLQNNTVLALTEDASGDLWVGMDKGIDLIALSSPIKFYTDFDGHIGTVYDAAIFEGRIYLGTNQGVFSSVLNAGNASFQLIPKTQGQVWNLEVIDGQLLCGHNNGTFLIQGTNASQISNVTGGWVIKKLAHHPELLLQGTYTHLCVYRKGKNGSWELAHKVENFSSSVRQWEEDEKGDIWVNNAPNGLSRLKLSPDTKKVLKKEDFIGSQLKGSSVNLNKIRNQIVVTTSNGLMIFDPSQQKFILSAEFRQQIGTEIRKVFSFSQKETLAIRKDGGLCVIQAEGKTKEIPIKRNQWVDDYENIRKIDEQNFVLCTENGFAVLPGKRIFSLTETKDGNPFIRSISVEDNPDLDRIFYENRVFPELFFEHNQNSLTISFSTTNYTNQVKYSFWLENSTKNWSPYSAATHKEFNSLSPGKYIFHLKSNLSNEETQLEFEILPPWYWNFWSKVFYIFLIGCLGYTSYRFHLRRLLIQKVRMQRKLEKRMRRQEELSQKEIMQLRNERLEQDIVRKSEELANSTMTLIKKNELLLNIRQEVNKLPHESIGRLNNIGSYKQILHLIESNISTEQDLQIFETNFNQVHEEFLKKLITNYPNLTPSDLKLAAYLRMNLSTKEIAQLFNITNRSVELKRYRLRKKLDLDTEVNLGEFMMKY